MSWFSFQKKQVEKTEHLDHTYLSVQLKVVQADITSEKVDAIVNAANEHLAHGGGVAGAISSRGGRRVQEDSTEYVRRHGPVETGEVAVTGPGNLPCQRIIHAVGPVSHGNFQEEDALLRNAIMNSYKKANELKLKSISIPAISSGIFGYPKPRCAKLFIRVTKEFVDYLQTLEKSEQSLKVIRFCNFDSETTNLFKDELEAFIKKGNIPPELPEAPKKPKYQQGYSSWGYGHQNYRQKKKDSDEDDKNEDEMQEDDKKEDDNKEDDKKEDDKDEDYMMVEAREAKKKLIEEEQEGMRGRDNEDIPKAADQEKNEDKREKKHKKKNKEESAAKVPVRDEQSEGDDAEEAPGEKHNEDSRLKDSCNSLNLADDFKSLSAKDNPDASIPEEKIRKADE